MVECQGNYAVVSSVHMPQQSKHESVLGQLTLIKLWSHSYVNTPDRIDCQLFGLSVCLTVLPWAHPLIQFLLPFSCCAPAASGLYLSIR